MPLTSIQDFWNASHARTARAGLPNALYSAGATPDQLQALDDSLSTGCPPGLAALLRQHNGAGAGWYCFGGGNFLSAAQVLAERAQRGRLAASLLSSTAGEPACVGPVRAVWWSDLWIPLLKRNKEPVCLDLSPARGGQPEQIIEVDWEGRTNRVLAPGLLAFLEQVLAAME